MAAKKKSDKQVSFTMDKPDQKKQVVRYYGSDDDPMTSAYISKTALKELGDPAEIRITIEAA